MRNVKTKEKFEENSGSRTFTPFTFLSNFPFHNKYERKLKGIIFGFSFFWEGSKRKKKDDEISFCFLLLFLMGRKEDDSFSFQKNYSLQ